MITRADYEQLARTIHGTPNMDDRLNKCITVANVLQAAFANFNRIKFIIACMGDEWEKTNDPAVV